MTRISLLLFLATFPLNLVCQTENEMVRDSTYSYYWDSETNEWIIDSKTEFFGQKYPLYPKI